MNVRKILGNVQKKGGGSMEGIFWLAVLILMVVIEAITLGLTTIWFAGGALAAFIAALVGAWLVVQVVLFFVVSFALLLGTRPFAVKYFNHDRARTNLESLIGAQAVVLEEIDNLQATGRVQVNGQEWSARSADGMAISKAETVQIEAIQGVKLMVKRREKMEE